MCVCLEGRCERKYQHVISMYGIAHVGLFLFKCTCMYKYEELPFSAVVDGWGLAVGDGVVGDGWRSFGCGGGGSGGRVGGAKIQAAVL